MESGKLKALTEKQQAIFYFVKNTIEDSGYPPTVREVADRFEITVKGAYDHLKAIEKKGYIKTEQNKSRAIVILTDDDAPDPKSAAIPLVGRIAAGTPVLARENIEDYLALPESAFRSGTYFALTVKGDSMIEAGISEGDIAIIRKQEIADSGEIVAVMVDDEATLKRLKVSGDKKYLVPENSAYSRFQITDNMSIIGKLTGIFRVY